MARSKSSNQRPDTFTQTVPRQAQLLLQSHGGPYISVSLRFSFAPPGVTDPLRSIMPHRVTFHDLAKKYLHRPCHRRIHMRAEGISNPSAEAVPCSETGALPASERT